MSNISNTEAKCTCPKVGFIPGFSVVVSRDSACPVHGRKLEVIVREHWLDRPPIKCAFCDRTVRFPMTYEASIVDNGETIDVDGVCCSEECAESLGEQAKIVDSPDRKEYLARVVSDEENRQMESLENAKEN